jgi:type I restriction enzyme, S subunit
MELIEYRFDEVTINFDKKRVPLSGAQREKRQGEYRYYGAQGVIDHIDDFIFDGTYLLIAEDGENLKSKKQNIAQVVEGQFWVNNHAHIVQGNELCNTRYLCYLLNSMDLSGYITGSAQPKLSQANLNAVILLLPPIHVQDKIVEYLYMLDRKITINQQINDNLQQQAQAIYTAMFIANADPAWEQGHLSDLITVKYGKDHKKLADGIYPVYGSGGIMRYVERPLYDKESVLIPRKGTLNNVMYVNQPFWSVDTMFYTEMRLPNVAKFVYHFVKAKDLASMNAGSAVPSMTTDILNAMEVVIPPASALEEFETLVAPMYRAMQENDAQSKKLADLRDALLPKLMSGEIDVSGIQL